MDKHLQGRLLTGKDEFESYLPRSLIVLNLKNVNDGLLNCNFLILEECGITFGRPTDTLFWQLIIVVMAIHHTYHK